MSIRFLEKYCRFGEKRMRLVDGWSNKSSYIITKTCITPAFLESKEV